MQTRIQKLRDQLLVRHPDSDLSPMSSADVRRQWGKYAGVPADFLEYLRVVGRGRIGRMRFMVYGSPYDPSFVYDPATAAKLDGVVLVGDDFAGHCVGYDTKGRRWRLGEVGSGGTFRTMFKLNWTPRRRAATGGRKRPGAGGGYDMTREPPQVRTFVEMVRDRFVAAREEADDEMDNDAQTPSDG